MEHVFKDESATLTRVTFFSSYRTYFAGHRLGHVDFQVWGTIKGQFVSTLSLTDVIRFFDG